MKRKIFLFLGSFACILNSFSQDNYEIQVYGSETVAPGATMLELHSNYTFGGSISNVNGVFGTHHEAHETLEVTHGFNRFFEIGCYLFNAIGSGGRTNYVGSHIRPRIRIPQEWNWPVGVSFSVEAGYQSLKYSEDDWSLEIRPIVDKTIGRLYLAFNPTFDKALHGINSNNGFIFSPNIKAGFTAINICTLGLEYYGTVGKIFGFVPFEQQQHQLFVAADLDINPDIEINFGYGIGLTKSTDNKIAKLILGYRFK